MKSPDPNTAYAGKAFIAKTTTLLLYAGLLLSLLIWQIVRPDGWSWPLLLIQTLPLLVFLPSMYKNNPRAYIGLCFIILMYFIKGVEGVFHPAMAWIDVGVLTFSVCIFISSMMTSRWLQFARIQQLDS